MTRCQSRSRGGRRRYRCCRAGVAAVLAARVARCGPGGRLGPRCSGATAAGTRADRPGPAASLCGRNGHVCLASYARRDGRTAEIGDLDPVDPQVGPAEEVEAGDDRHRLRAALARVPEPERGWLVAHEANGLPVVTPASSGASATLCGHHWPSAVQAPRRVRRLIHRRRIAKLALPASVAGHRRNGPGQ